MKGFAALPFAAVVLGSLLLTGCASVSDRMEDTAKSAAAAASGAALAVQLHRDSGATTAATDTVLTDALSELETTAQDAVEAEPTTAAERSVRATTLAAIRAATDAVVASRESLASGGDPDPAALKSATAVLEDLAG